MAREFTEDQRIVLATSGIDCALIPKVNNAGMVFDGPDGKYQVMHNGVKVRTDSHYGPFNVEVIRRLRGHHEPQEEFVFYELLKRIGPGGVMLEVGAFWAYYSLWFLSAVPDADVVLVEPWEHALDAGRRNFALNRRNGLFIHAAIADRISEAGLVELWPGFAAEAPCTTVDALLLNQEMDRIAVLHADIQGAEVKMLLGAQRSLKKKLIDWVVISTHGENVHQRCIQLIEQHRYKIVASHTPSESYSVDGLVVAAADSRERVIRVSRRWTFSGYKAKLRAMLRVRCLEPLGVKSRTS